MMSTCVTSGAKLDQELGHVRDGLVGLMTSAREGIVSGLEVTAIENTIAVSSGSLFLGGTLFNLSAVDGLHVDMTPGVRGYIVVTRGDVESYGTDPYNRTVQTGSAPHAEVSVASQPVGVVLAYYEVVNRILEDTSGNIVTSENSGAFQGKLPIEAPYIVSVGNAGVTSAVVKEYGNTVKTYTYTPGSVAPDCFTFDNLGWFKFHSSNAGAQISINYRYQKPVEEPVLVVDTSADRNTVMRPSFTMKDTRHCDDQNIVGNNVHGVSFNDMNQDFPLHSQIFDTGFSTTSNSDVDGLLGSMYKEFYTPFPYTSGLLTKYRFLLDMFGLITGTPGRQYVRLKYTPLVVTYVVNKLTREPIQFEVYDNAVAFGTSAQFDASEIEVGYTAVKCLDVKLREDNSATVLGGDDIIVISEGMEVKVPEDIQVNLGAYTNVPVDLTLALDSNAEAVVLPAVIDSAKLSSKTSSDFQFPVSIHGQAQVAVTLRNTPLRNALKPPVGRLSVVTDASSVYGTRRFIYTYSKENTILTIVNRVATAIQDEYNLSGSYVRRGSEIVEHDAWMYVADKKRVVVANSVYENVANPRFQLWSGAALSSRNRRGYTEVIGTAEVPDGPKASCTISQIADVRSGDTFTYKAASKSVTKTYLSTNSTFYGTNNEWIATTLMLALASEPLVQASGFVFDCVENKITISSGIASSDLRVSFANANARVSNFTLIDNVYVATIEILSPRFSVGDYVSLRVDSASSHVTKTWRTDDVFEADTFSFEALCGAFNMDMAFLSLGATMLLGEGIVTLVSGDNGTQGNTNSFTTSGSGLSVTAFQGGLDTAVPDFNDVSGVTLTIEDEQEYDKTGVFHVYCTDNLASGGSETKYYHVADVPQSAGMSTYYATLDYANFDKSDLIDLDTEFSLSVALSGTDASGNSLFETVTLTPLNFCEYVDAANGETNEMQFVRTSNMFATITQWAVTEKKSIGTTEIVLLSELTAGSRDLYEVATLNWNGTVVQSKIDRRKFVPSTTYQDPSLVIGEAVGTMSLLFKAVL